MGFSEKELAQQKFDKRQSSAQMYMIARRAKIVKGHTKKLPKNIAHSQL